MAIALAACSYPQEAAAEGFTGKEFLTWDRGNQNSFIETSITMIGIVASQGWDGATKCLNDWYFTNHTIRSREHDEIIALIRDYPDFHPQGVILGFIERKCGKLRPGDG